jgi:hypothetical protein
MLELSDIELALLDLEWAYKERSFETYGQDERVERVLSEISNVELALQELSLAIEELRSEDE